MLLAQGLDRLQRLERGLLPETIPDDSSECVRERVSEKNSTDKDKGRAGGLGGENLVVDALPLTTLFV